MKRKNSSYFFQPIQCGECQSVERLMMHKYKDNVLCVSCVQDLIEKEDSETDLCKACNGSGEGFHNNESDCIHCDGKGVS